MVNVPARYFDYCSNHCEKFYANAAFIKASKLGMDWELAGNPSEYFQDERLLVGEPDQA